MEYRGCGGCNPLEHVGCFILKTTTEMTEIIHLYQYRSLGFTDIFQEGGSRDPKDPRGSAPGYPYITIPLNLRL